MFGKSCRQNILILVFIAFHWISGVCVCVCVCEKSLPFSQRSLFHAQTSQRRLAVTQIAISKAVMDAKMLMTIRSLGLEPPNASLLRRFPDGLQPLGPLLGLRGVGGAPLVPPAHLRPIVEDVEDDEDDEDVEDLEDVEDDEDVEDLEDVEDVEVCEDREASTAPRTPSTDSLKGRTQGEQGEQGEKGDDHLWALSTEQLWADSLRLIASHCNIVSPCFDEVGHDDTSWQHADT